jgi:UDP-N-acetylmuramyl tripeptide synthase
MTLPVNSFVSNEVHDQFVEVAQTMRNLADLVASFADHPAPKKIGQISADIRKVGWNSLFAASMLEAMEIQTAQIIASEVEKDKYAVLQQIDGLFTAVSYLSKSVSMVKAELPGLADLEKEMLLDQLRSLGVKVEELADECYKS